MRLYFLRLPFVLAAIVGGALVIGIAAGPLTVTKKPHGRKVKEGRDELVKTDVTLSDGRIVPIVGGTLPDGSGMGWSEQEPVDVGDEVDVDHGRLVVKKKAKKKQALLGGLVAVAEAYTYNGHHWPDGQYSYYVNTTNPPPPTTLTPEQMIESLDAAVQRWPAQSNAQLTITMAGSTTNNMVAGNHHNDIFWVDGASSVTGRAAETYHYWGADGLLYDADMRSYTKYGTWYPLTGCVKAAYHEPADSIWTHEFGHALGFGHSTITTATMYPSIPAQCDTSWRTLDPDDVTMVRVAYGATGPVPVTLPSVPRIFQPSDGGNLAQANGQYIRWYKSSAATSYDIYISTDPTPAYKTSVAPPNCTCVSTWTIGTLYYPVSALPAGTYYWRIVAKNAGGAVTSPTWSFTK